MIFKVVGFLILITFYGCYFAKMISQKKKGIQTDQIGKGKSGSTKTIEVTMKISTYLVPFAEVISIVIGTTVFPTGLRIAGACLGGAGVVIFMISVVTMRDSWRAGVSKKDRTELVTNGIYQVSRNPAFLGFDLVYIGILLMFFNWILLVFSVFAAIMFHLQIVKVEEKFLLGAFGVEYLCYQNRVRRYIGRTL